MRRWLIVLLAVGVAVSLAPMKAAQAASIFKTDDGLEFKFGLAQKVQFHTMNHFDLTENVPGCANGECNFRSLSVPDITIGNQELSVWNFTNLLFDLSKGPVSIHANLEVEAAMDERQADVNHLNLERANLTWRTGVIGDLVVGFDVHLFDPEGGLIYQDEDPGIWLIGSQGPISWNIGYHKRLQKNRGNQLGLGGVAGPPFTTAANPRDHDANIFEARLGFNLPLPGGNIGISPLFVYYARHVPQSGPADETGNLVACPTGGCVLNLSVADDSKADIFFPGVVLTGKFGPIQVTIEGVGQFGEIRDFGAGSVYQALYGNKADIESFAAFGELALDLTSQGIGLTPFINVDYRSGDDNPFDDKLQGYVAISDLTSALRKDGFKFQSLTSMGTPMFGAGGEAAWGFNTGGRGIGPSIGSIIDDISLNSGVFFNNRFGKADNPGMLKITGGFLGKITPQVDMKAAASYLRFDTVESIQAEALVNRLARGAPATSFNVSEDMGVELNFNIGWSPVPAFRIQPFVSVFIPMDGADDVSRLFLDSSETQIGYLAGLEFRAQF